MSLNKYFAIINYEMNKRLQKEYELQETLGGEHPRRDGIEWWLVDEEKLHFRAAIFGPIGSVYEGGVWYFDIHVPDTYPM